MALDMNEAVRRVVIEEMDRVLAPHREALARLEAFLGMKTSSGVSPSRPASARRQPQRARKPRPSATGSALRNGTAAKPGSAPKLSEGQPVRFRQGRGTFDATVVKLDTGNGLVTLRRKKDGKQFLRKPDQIYGAA